MRVKDKSRWKKPLGIVLIIIGIIGCFLPFIQGILTIGIGLGLLGYDVRKIKKRIENDRTREVK